MFGRASVEALGNKVSLQYEKASILNRSLSHKCGVRILVAWSSFSDSLFLAAARAFRRFQISTSASSDCNFVFCRNKFRYSGGGVWLPAPSFNFRVYAASDLSPGICYSILAFCSLESVSMAQRITELMPNYSRLPTPEDRIRLCLKFLSRRGRSQRSASSRL